MRLFSKSEFLLFCVAILLTAGCKDRVDSNLAEQGTTGKSVPQSLSMENYIAHCEAAGITIPKQISCFDAGSAEVSLLSESQEAHKHGLYQNPSQLIQIGVGRTAPGTRFKRYDLGETTCVLACRKYGQEGNKPQEFSDVNMICQNIRANLNSGRLGATCFFNSKLGSDARTATSKMKLSEHLPPLESQNFWSPLEGIRKYGCSKCHLSSAFLRTPYTKVLIDDHKIPIVPDTSNLPYQIVDIDYLAATCVEKAFSPGMEVLYSRFLRPRLANIAAPCRDCHRMGSPNYLNEVLDRDTRNRHEVFRKNTYQGILLRLVGAMPSRDCSHSCGTLTKPSWYAMPPADALIGHEQEFLMAYQEIMACIRDRTKCNYAPMPPEKELAFEPVFDLDLAQYNDSLCTPN